MVNAIEQVYALQAKLTQTGDGKGQETDRFWFEYYCTIARSLPNLEMVYPSLTFETNLTIVGSDRLVELINGGDAHTGGDLILYLPYEKVAFMADLLFVGCHPYLADGDPDAWVTILDKVLKMDIDVFLPGHGPVGNRDDVTLLIEYIHTLRDLVISHPSSDGVELEIPAHFRDWLFPSFFKPNCHFIFNQISGGK
jgi:glyoxylase-like metal-dependent hydrolase (beta-lactamase superfamily II)